MKLNHLTPEHAGTVLAAMGNAGDSTPLLAEAIDYLTRLRALPRIGPNPLEPVVGMRILCQWPLLFGLPFVTKRRAQCATVRVVSVHQYDDGPRVTAQEIGHSGMMHGIDAARWREIAEGATVINAGEPRWDLLADGNA